MKNLFTIRSNLTIINIVVTAIIFLLVSFIMVEALQHKREASFLATSVDIDSKASDYLSALVEERRLYKKLVNRNQPVLTEERNQYKDLAQTSHRAIDELIRRVEHDSLDSARFFKGTMLSRVQTERSVADLALSATHASVYRDYSVDELAHTRDKRDQSIYQLLIPSLNQTLDQVRRIATGTSYLPTRSSVQVDRYQEVSNNYWDLYKRIAVYDELLSAINYSDFKNHLTTTAAADEFADHETEIKYAWKQLLDINVTNSQEQRLVMLIDSAKEQYYGRHTRLHTQLKAGSLYGYGQFMSESMWEKSIEETQAKLKQVIDASQNRLVGISEDLDSEAMRSLAIIASLLIISLIASFLLFWLGKRIKKEADTDSLTGLANRFTIESTLKKYETPAEVLNTRQAIISIDLDGFKKINDNYGYGIGDQILIETGQRIKETCPNDLVARVGADEFAIYCRNLEIGTDVEEKLNTIIRKLEETYRVSDATLKLSAHAGYAIAPDDSAVGPPLLKNADIALNRTKGFGVSQHHCRFDSSIGDSHLKRRQLEEGLLAALEKREFTLLYQPKVCSITQTVRSVEALIRWQTANGDLISPADFIPVAEELGLMQKIGNWVLDQACNDISTLQKQGFAGLGVAVNISPQQFNDELFCKRVLSATSKAQLGSGYLELEITESIVLHDIDRVTHFLSRLRAQGVSIAIDDFGTGYSSLKYLQDLPLDTLKIDRAFVDKLDKTLPHQTVANSIVQLAVLFGLTTVAEGVENEAQRREVSNLGIDLIQGYLFSKPVSMEDLPATIREIESRESSDLPSGQDSEITGENDFGEPDRFGKAA